MTPNSQSQYSLLVIDDEPDLRTLYELTLLREGYEVETAGSVEEALQMLKERSYSAVISDMRLPDGSGLDVLWFPMLALAVIGAVMLGASVLRFHKTLE